MKKPLLQNETIKVLTSTRLVDYMTRRPTHFVSRMALNNTTINLCSTNLKKKYASGVITENGWQTHCYYRLPFSNHKVVSKVNSMRFKKFITKNISPDDIIWAYEPFTIDFYKNSKRKLLVYEMCDDTSAYFINDKVKHEYILSQEKKICGLADIVITISDYLWKQKNYLNSNFHVVRNGADYSYFRNAFQLNKSEKDELFNIEGPIVGYHGAISLWIDFELVSQVATSLTQFQFVFVGRINSDCQGKVKKLMKLPNVHFLGERKYLDLVHYLKYFDITIIPFVIDQLILSVNPIKMYEYLSAGKPVLSTPLPEVRFCEKEGVIETATNSVSFTSKIQKLFDVKDNSYLIKERMDLAYKNSWDLRYQQLEKLVSDTIKRKAR